MWSMAAGAGQRRATTLRGNLFDDSDDEDDSTQHHSTEGTMFDGSKPKPRVQTDEVLSSSVAATSRSGVKSEVKSDGKSEGKSSKSKKTKSSKEPKADEGGASMEEIAAAKKAARKLKEKTKSSKDSKGQDATKRKSKKETSKAAGESPLPSTQMEEFTKMMKVGMPEPVLRLKITQAGVIDENEIVAVLKDLKLRASGAQPAAQPVSDEGAEDRKKHKKDKDKKDKDKKLKINWREAKDPSSGNSYFFNKKTGETTWDPPEQYKPLKEEKEKEKEAPPTASKERAVTEKERQKAQKDDGSSTSKKKKKDQSGNDKNIKDNAGEKKKEKKDKEKSSSSSSFVEKEKEKTKGDVKGTEKHSSSPDKSKRTHRRAASAQVPDNFDARPRGDSISSTSSSSSKARSRPRRGSVDSAAVPAVNSSLHSKRSHRRAASAQITDDWEFSEDVKEKEKEKEKEVVPRGPSRKRLGLMKRSLSSSGSLGGKTKDKDTSKNRRAPPQIVFAEEEVDPLSASGEAENDKAKDKRKEKDKDKRAKKKDKPPNREKEPKKEKQKDKRCSNEKEEPDIAEKWVKVDSGDGKFYFYNNKTRETRWTDPAEDNTTASTPVFKGDRADTRPKGIYTHSDGQKEKVSVVKKMTDAEGGGYSVYIPSLQRERLTTEERFIPDPEATSPADPAIVNQGQSSSDIASAVVKVLADVYGLQPQDEKVRTQAEAQLAELTAQKTAAVEAEDYDAAKALKLEIDRIQINLDGLEAKKIIAQGERMVETSANGGSLRDLVKELVAEQLQGVQPPNTSAPLVEPGLRTSLPSLGDEVDSGSSSSAPPPPVEGRMARENEDGPQIPLLANDSNDDSDDDSNSDWEDDEENNDDDAGLNISASKDDVGDDDDNDDDDDDWDDDDDDHVEPAAQSGGVEESALPAVTSSSPDVDLPSPQVPPPAEESSDDDGDSGSDDGDDWD